MDMQCEINDSSSDYDSTKTEWTDKLLKNDIIYGHFEPFEMVKINKNATFFSNLWPNKIYLHFTSVTRV